MNTKLLVVLSVSLMLTASARAELPVQLDPVPQPPTPGIVVPPPVTPDKSPTPSSPAAVTTTNELRLTVSLTDGSRLIGTTTVRELPLTSDALGKLAVPLAKVRELKLSKTGTADLTLRNGDRLQAGLALQKLPLLTVFGLVQVPVAEVTAITFADGGGQSMSTK